LPPFLFTIRYRLHVLNETDVSTAAFCDNFLAHTISLGEFDGIGLVVGLGSSSPVVALVSGSNEVISTINFSTIVVDGQEHAASGLESVPLSGSHGNGGSSHIVVASIVAAEVVGEDDETLNGFAFNSQLSVEEAVTGAGVEQVAPLVGGEGTPEVGSVATVGDDVVTPLVDTSQIVGTGQIVVGTTHVPNLVSITGSTVHAVVATVVAVSTPADHVAILLSVGSLVDGIQGFPLVVGELPERMAADSIVLEVAFCKADSLVSADGENTVYRTNRVGGEGCTGEVDVDDGVQVTLDSDGHRSVLHILSVARVEGNFEHIVGAGGQSNLVDFCTGNLGLSNLHGDGLGAMVVVSGNEHGLGGVSHVDVEITVKNLLGADGDAVNSHVGSDNQLGNTTEVSEQVARLQGLLSIEGEMFVDLTAYTVLNSGQADTTGRNCTIPGEDTNDGTQLGIKGKSSVDVLDKIEGSQGSRSIGRINSAIAILVNETDAVATIPVESKTLTILVDLHVVENLIVLEVDANAIGSIALFLVTGSHCHTHCGDGKDVNRQFFHFFSPCLVLDIVTLTD